MNGCRIESRLDAYYDGELEAAEQARIAEHVQGCPACRMALEQMRQMSALLAGDRPDAVHEVGASEIARIHAAVNREMNRSAFQVDRSFWRAAVLVSGLAASVLIIASAWLMETPAPRTQPLVAVEPTAPQPAWERVAMTLQADPLPYAWATG